MVERLDERPMEMEELRSRLQEAEETLRALEEAIQEATRETALLR